MNYPIRMWILNSNRHKMMDHGQRKRKSWERTREREKNEKSFAFISFPWCACVCVYIYIFLYIQKYPLFLSFSSSFNLLLFSHSSSLNSYPTVVWPNSLLYFFCSSVSCCKQVFNGHSSRQPSSFVWRWKQKDARTDSINAFDDLPTEENLSSFSLYTYKHTYIFETSVFFVRFVFFCFSSLFYLFKQTKQQICVSFNVHQFCSNENDDGERQMRISNKFQNLFPFLNHPYLCFSIDLFI